MIDSLPINFAIIKHPINWVIVVLMVLIAGFFAHLVVPSILHSTTSN